MLTLCALTVLGADPFAWPTYDAAALVDVACGDSRDCRTIVPVLWHMETRLHPFPRCGKSGCGPLQVLPSRYVTGYRLTDPVDGLRAGWHVYRIKRARARDVRQGFEFYNGSGRAKSYATRAHGLWRRVMATCGEVMT